ncbi:Arm DNA-binding domain-containing protein [Microvirga sp. 0TCS3.31]
MRLTRPALANLALPPGRSELIVFDDTLPGFGVRLGAGGKRVWIAQYRMGQKQRRVTIGSVETLDPDQARKAAKSILAKVHLGSDPQYAFSPTRTATMDLATYSPRQTPTL